MPSLTTPPTFVDGTVPTAANLNNLSTNIETLGQLTIGRSSTPTGAKPGFNPPATKVSLVNPPTIPTSTTTTVEWDLEDLDTDFAWSTLIANHLIIRTAGWYRIEAQLAWSITGAGERQTLIAINGATDPTNVTASCTTYVPSAVGTRPIRQQCYAYEHLAAGATVQVLCWQNTGADAQLLTVAYWKSWLSVAWDAPY